jgi:hypothetical protein
MKDVLPIWPAKKITCLILYTGGVISQKMFAAKRKIAMEENAMKIATKSATSTAALKKMVSLPMKKIAWSIINAAIILQLALVVKKVSIFGFGRYQ